MCQAMFLKVTADDAKVEKQQMPRFIWTRKFLQLDKEMATAKLIPDANET